MTRVASIGECMLEISGAGSDPDLRRLRFGGDTLNTAVYLARLGVAVDYVTALGDDPYSTRMIEAWQAEGIGTPQVQRIAGRLPGLYMIELDDKGERRFFYWRQQAPAREIFGNDAAAALCNALLQYDWLYLSGISLSLYGEAGRDRLFELLRRFRSKGGKVAFDSNYRPRGWPSVEVARREIRDQLALTDLALGDGVRVDAVLTALPTAEDNIKGGQPFKILGDPVYYEDLGIALDQKSPLDSKGLADEITKIVDEMHKDGTLTNLAKKYYSSDLTTKK